MDVLFSILDVIFKGVGLVVAGFIGLIVFAVLFGKKVESRYDLEAEFLDDDGKEIAEFDIKLWRYAKEAGNFQLKASFTWKDSQLSVGDKVQVFLQDLLVMEGIVEKATEIKLFKQHIKNTPDNAKQGNECRVLVNGNQRLCQAMIND